MVMLFSLIVVAVYGVSRGCMEIYDRSQQFNLEQRKIILGLERLTGDLRQIVSLDRLEAHLPQGWCFEGSCDKMSFIGLCSLKDESQDSAGLCRLSYVFENDTEGCFKLRLIQTDAKEQEPQLERDLAGGIKKGSSDKFFQYLEYDDELQDYEWVDEWGQDEQMPKAVRVQVSYETQGKDGEETQTFTKKIFLLQ